MLTEYSAIARFYDENNNHFAVKDVGPVFAHNLGNAEQIALEKAHQSEYADPRVDYYVIVDVEEIEE